MPSGVLLSTRQATPRLGPCYPVRPAPLLPFASGPLPDPGSSSPSRPLLTGRLSAGGFASGGPAIAAPAGDLALAAVLEGLIDYALQQARQYLQLGLREAGFGAGAGCVGFRARHPGKKGRNFKMLKCSD